MELQSISNRDNVVNHHVSSNNFYHKNKCWTAIVLTTVLMGAIGIYVLYCGTTDSISSGELLMSALSIFIYVLCRF
jgi:hypothetical protein